MSNRKTSLLLAVLLLPLCLLAPDTRAALLFYEGFDYPKGEELGQTSTSSACWENDKSQFTVVAGSLEFAGLQPTAGHRLNVTPAHSSLDSVRTAKGAWPAQSSGTLFVSFLLKVESPDGIENAGHGTPVLTVGKSANGAQLFGVSLLNRDGVRLGAVKYSNALPASSEFCTNGIGANLPANGSTTCLVVARYEWVDGPDNNIVTVWVNPPKLGGPQVPAGQASTMTGVDDAAPAGRLTLCRGPHVNLDEIRIGQTWADVTPTGIKMAATNPARMGESSPEVQPSAP